MYRLNKYRVGRGIARSSFCLILLIGIMSCNDNPIDPLNTNEDYLFINMFIWSYAIELEGDCDILIVAIEPHTFYTYDPATKSLSYRHANPFLISDDLQLVTGFNHVYAPLAGVFDAKIAVIPSYNFPDQITGLTNIHTVDSLGTTVEMSVGFSSKPHSTHSTIRLPTSIHLAPDSTFQRVFKTIVEGDTLSGGENCILEYTDSLVITNYGLNPKSNISWEPIAGPG